MGWTWQCGRTNTAMNGCCPHSTGLLSLVQTCSSPTLTQQLLCTSPLGLLDAGRSTMTSCQPTQTGQHSDQQTTATPSWRWPMQLTSGYSRLALRSMGKLLMTFGLFKTIMGLL